MHYSCNDFYIVSQLETTLNMTSKTIITSLQFSNIWKSIIDESIKKFTLSMNYN